MTDRPAVECLDLGLISFQEAWTIQERYFEEVVERKKRNRDKPEDLQETRKHYLLFCEHPHVYTLGRNGKADHLLIDEQKLKAVGAEFLPINRGGDITYHGPGQLVGYPILDLDDFTTDIHEYLRRLEEVVIRTLGSYGLVAERSVGETGVWLDTDGGRPRKICAMGIRASRWVTMHGWALNHQVDMRYFDYIVPCGIQGKAVTSMDRELGGSNPGRKEVRNELVRSFSEVFNCTCRWPENSSNAH